MASFSYVENAVEMWGLQKGILGAGGRGTPQSQALKTLEEVEELLSAVEANNRDEIIDAIGDIVVTLIMQCHIQNVTLTDCLESAYNVISKRKGKMVDGQFVKEA